MSSAVAPALQVRPIPLFDDNYCWRIDDAAHGISLLVDPADPDAVFAAFGADAPEPVTALITHHHWDHAGGAKQVAAKGIAVVAGSGEEGRVEGATQLVGDGEDFVAGGHVKVRALHTPCHTKGHVCYFIDGAQPMVFTGDTLFAGGCGKFFEGTAAQMHSSLTKLAALPDATLVYCGHEYTVSNLKFCRHVEPDNADTTERLKEAEGLRAAGKPTVPSTIDLEKRTNVFMRCAEAAVQRFTHPDATERVDPVEVMARLREAKNAFRAT